LFVVPGIFPFLAAAAQKKAGARRWDAESAFFLLVMAQPHRIDYHPSIKSDVPGE
jgi:hypothetical protein